MEINYSQVVLKMTRREDEDIALKRHTMAVEFKETAKKQNRNYKEMEF